MTYDGSQFKRPVVIAPNLAQALGQGWTQRNALIITSHVNARGVSFAGREVHFLGVLPAKAEMTALALAPCLHGCEPEEHPELRAWLADQIHA